MIKSKKTGRKNRSRNPLILLLKKDLILQAAALLFAEKGFKDTSISDLANATGTAEGTIFYHFKNKEHLFISILEQFKLEIVGQCHDAYAMARANAVCWKHLEAIYDCLLDIIERAVVLGQRDGSVGPMAPRKAALIIFSMVDGLVRLNTYNLYHAGALHGELITCCRRMLKNELHAASDAGRTSPSGVPMQPRPVA